MRVNEYHNSWEIIEGFLTCIDLPPGGDIGIETIGRI